MDSKLTIRQNRLNQALYEAVKHNHIIVAIELLKNGADPNYEFYNPNTYMNDSCSTTLCFHKNGDLTMLKVLQIYGLKLDYNMIETACNVLDNDDNFRLIEYLLTEMIMKSDRLIELVEKKNSPKTLHYLRNYIISPLL